MKKSLLAPIIVLFSIASIFLENCKKPDEDYYRTNDIENRGNGDENEEVDSLEFSDEEIALIMEGDSADLMRVLQIHTINGTDTITNLEDSLNLRKVCLDIRVDTSDTVLTRLIDRMFTTVNDPLHPGMGIAAPQIGVRRNIIWVQRLELPGDPWEVYLNPKIIAYSEITTVYPSDGCLSIPGMTEATDRYRLVCVEYDKPDGTHHTEVVEGIGSIIFQHEIDHLNGILFLDRIHVSKNVLSKEDFDEFASGLE